ncbi:MAG TPA: L,D-transpeptidase [Chthoniobacteraceae bacterium]|nr:L,D-transpeptidase [Chthoniobacteraceae bacterium]
MIRALLTCVLSCLAMFRAFAGDTDICAVVSVPDQKIAVVENGCTVARYPVSTSRYGVGDRFNSYATPLGYMEIAGKIGAGAPLGAVFKNRRMTGEILRPNSPGRDPIVTRIIWLRGLENCNENAFSRNIYIHGTPVERLIGRPASYGCIRMRSRDVIQLFNLMPVGARVEVSKQSLGRAVAAVSESVRYAINAAEEDRVAFYGR